MLNGSTELCVLEKGTMNEEIYSQDIIVSYVNKFRCAVGNCFMFTDNVLRIYEGIDRLESLRAYQSYFHRTTIG